jgi:hypothetical protein
MNTQTPSVLDRLKTAYLWGPVAGVFAVFFFIFEAIVIMLTDTFWPEEDIDIVRSFDSKMYNEDVHSFGNHTLTVDIKDKRSQKQLEENIVIDNTFSTSTHRLRVTDHKRRFQTVKPETQIIKPETQIIISKQIIKT